MAGIASILWTSSCSSQPVRLDPFWRKDLRKLNDLIQLVAVAALVLMGHPDTALAQLTYSPNQSLVESISGPGGTATDSVTVSSTAGTVTALSVGTPVQSNGPWLCASNSGAQISISGHAHPIQFVDRNNSTGQFVIDPPYSIVPSARRATRSDRSSPSA